MWVMYPVLENAGYSPSKLRAEMTHDTPQNLFRITQLNVYMLSTSFKIESGRNTKLLDVLFE